MDPTKLKISSDLKIKTAPLEGEKLDSQNLFLFEASEMESIERRIVDWLEEKNIEMADPCDKEIYFFAEQRKKTLSFRKADRVKSFSLDESPLFLRHKKSSSPCQKLSSFFTPDKKDSQTNFMCLSEKEMSDLTKSTIDKFSMSESLNEMKRTEKENDFSLKISEFDF